ncbi:MAG TPA: sugar ABC transporter permease [Thermomicrobiales bacterium]|nr:sugar ABC transporter permease [Thermomicrobiales bacterium]
MSRREGLTPYLFLLPAMLLILVWRYIPIIAGLRESFYSNAFSFTGAKEFVGWDNYRYLFDDPTYWESVRVTLKFNAIVNVLQVALSLGLALLINQKVRGIGFFRTLLLLPIAISINVAALAWGLALDPTYGLVNGILERLHLPTQPFLLSADQALWVLIGIVSWIGVPYWALFFLAGLQNIPQEIHEAARIDGANPWQGFFHITFPLLSRTTTFVLVATTVANFTMFAPPYLLTNGGPSGATNLIMFDAWKRGFTYGDLGASAASITVFLGVLIIVVAAEFLVFRPQHD